MKITNEIFQVGGSGLTSDEDAAIYLINFNGHAALVDSGCGRAIDKILKNIKSHGVSYEQVEYLFLTHCHFDHTGGAGTLKNILNCSIIAHELDAPFLEKGDSIVTAANWYGAKMQCFTVDIKLKGGHNDISLADKNIKAIHTPGHSPGSVVYLIESEGLKVLFAQDVHGPLHSSFLSDKKDYIRSLELMLSLEADILCEGHFGIYKGKKEVADFINSFIIKP